MGRRHGFDPLRVEREAELAPRSRPVRGADPEEWWEDVRGYEGLYQVSNYGRVLSLARLVERIDHYPFTVPESLLAPTPCPPAGMTRGHYTMGLSVDGKTRSVHLHRLVALHFVPNPHGLSRVDYLEEDWRNVHASNLGWATSTWRPHEGSARYAFRDPAGQVHLTENISAFCREHQLTRAAMSNVACGRRAHHRGWTLA